MARTNTKIVTKYYDQETVNGWVLNYEYESENGAAPAEIRVTSQKESASLYMNKTAGNTGINFNGAGLDSEVVAAVTTAFEEIAAGFAVEE